MLIELNGISDDFINYINNLTENNSKNIENIEFKYYNNYYNVYQIIVEFVTTKIHTLIILEKFKKINFKFDIKQIIIDNKIYHMYIIDWLIDNNYDINFLGHVASRNMGFSMFIYMLNSGADINNPLNEVDNIINYNYEEHECLVYYFILLEYGYKLNEGIKDKLIKLYFKYKDYYGYDNDYYSDDYANLIDINYTDDENKFIDEKKLKNRKYVDIKKETTFYFPTAYYYIIMLNKKYYYNKYLQ